MQGLNFQKTIRQAWFYLFFAVITSVVIVYIAIGIIQKDLFEYIVKEVNLHHKVITSLVDKFKNEEEALIRMISSNPDVKSFAENQTDDTEIKKLFLNFAKAQSNIMQLRFIDINGNEKFRVDQDKTGKIKVFRQSELQNKSDRYYVKEFMKLNNDEVGYSEFDLNVERNIIEIPFNPTLRMGKGVYVNNRLAGIIVINFYMEEWIKYTLNFANVKVSMINKDGYFMMHYDPKWAWSEFITTPKKALEHPLIEYIPNWQEDESDFYKLSNYAIGKRLKLFSKDVFVIYRLTEPINTIIIQKVLQLSVIFVLAFLPVALSLVYLIYRYVQHTKQNSAFLQEIINNMFDAIILIDKNAIIKHVNHTTVNIFGYSEDELIGNNIKMLVPEPHKGLHDQYVQNYQHQERTIIGKQRDLNGVHKDGSEIAISLAVTKVSIDNDFYFIGAARDLREMKKLEAMSKSQEAMLIQQSKLASMGEMIGAIAHQWRQPLNELTIRIQKLKYNYAKEEIDEAFIQRFIEKNKVTIDFMSRTIDDFRNFFRIEKDKKAFLIKESIEEVLSLQNAQLKEHNIKVELQGEEFSFNGYKTEFQQVIINLISNSKDALVSKNIPEPKIIIKQDKQKITIEDNAGGIPKDVLDRVFEPYFTTKEQGDGTGMGLYLSKMIIEDNMCGKIKLLNTENGLLVKIDLMEQK